jgi:hypothetical protein
MGTRGALMKTWYCYLNDQTYGPYSENQMRDMLRTGQINGDTLIYCADPSYTERGWVSAKDTDVSGMPGSEVIMEEKHTNDVKKRIMLKILKIVVTGGLWLIWIFVKAMWRNTEKNLGDVKNTMESRCMFGRHKWNGCTCENCGTVRDSHHRMVRALGECTEECAICGKIGRTVHKYRWNPDIGDRICVVCGISKESKVLEFFDPVFFIVGRVGKWLFAVGKGLLFGLLALVMLMVLFGVYMEEKERHPILAIGLIAFFILCVITTMLLRHLHLKRQQDIDILNADIHKISDDEAARRAEKYRR